MEYLEVGLLVLIFATILYFNLNSGRDENKNIQVGDGPLVPDLEDPVDLTTMTKAQLLEEAEKRGVQVAKSATKAKIILALEQASLR